MPLRHARACWTALVLIAATAAPTASAQVVIRERVEVSPFEVHSGPPLAAATVDGGWTFTESGTVTLVLSPNQASGGTSIVQCFETLDHDLRLTFYGSREGEVLSLDVGALIDNTYVYSYPECDPYISYGFPEAHLPVGPVEAGDVVVVEYLRNGVLLGAADPATYPDEMSNDNGRWYYQAPWEDGAVRDVFGAGNDVDFGGSMGSISYVFVDFLASQALSLDVDRDTLLVTEAARVTVGGVTDPDAVVTLLAATPHGRLVRVVGADTTAVSGPLAWSEIEGSEVFFIADGEWPESDATIRVSGALDDEEASTETLTLLAPELRFDLDVDPKTYLPIRDDTLTATIHLDHLPDGLRPSIDVALTQDYEFTFLDGTTGSRTVPLEANSANVRLLSKQWWGVATVQATVQGRTASDTLKVQFQVPIDSDGDTIADSWELAPPNVGTLALGGNTDDAAWDEETSPGTSNNGDGWSKIQEYQGFLIGTDHVRLSPGLKEVFFDIRDSRYGAATLVEVRNQLNLIPIEVEGTPALGPSHLYNFPLPGPRALQLISPTTQAFVGTPKLVYVRDAGLPPDPQKNGIVIQNGVFVVGGVSSTLQPRYEISYGRTNGTVSNGGSISRVHDTTIYNIWNSNSASEADNVTLTYTVPVQNYTNQWTAVFNGGDINRDGDNTDVFNPFDLLSPGRSNDPSDGRVATVLQGDFHFWNTLHEVGHALGMSPGNNHPQKNAGAMREGPGPARTGTFTASDIGQIKLK